MIFCGIRRKFYKFHGNQQNAMANLETGHWNNFKKFLGYLDLTYNIVIEI